jgi:hypothetical protein
VRNGRFIAALAVFVALVSGAVGAVSVFGDRIQANLSSQFASQGGAAALKICQEDEPCWDWKRMGNRVRGVYPKNSKGRQFYVLQTTVGRNAKIRVGNKTHVFAYGCYADGRASKWVTGFWCNHFIR